MDPESEDRNGVEALQRALADRLLSLFERVGSRDWRWCEDHVTYDNARLPQALIVSGTRLGSADMTAAGLRSLEWLATIQCSEEGYFTPVGSNGFYQRSSEMALFDQQPLEACAMVSACLDAWRVTGEQRCDTGRRLLDRRQNDIVDITRRLCMYNRSCKRSWRGKYSRKDFY